MDPAPSTGRLIRADASAEYYFEEGCFILELSNDSQDPECSIARARVPAGGETRWHMLRDTTERYVVLEGSGEVQVGGLIRRVRPGDVVLIPASVPQRIRNLGSTDLVFLAVCTPRFTPDCYTALDIRGEDDP